MILLFYGGNSFAIRQKMKELSDRYQSQSGNNFGLERFDGSDQNLAADSVISAMTNLPLLSESRLVIIEDLLSNKTLAESVVKILDQVPKSTVAVFIESPGDERLKLFKELKAKSKAQSFLPLPGAQLKNWVQKTVTDMGGKINDSSSTFLIERAGTDQWRLYNEMSKLINFDKTITRETITEMVEPSFQSSIFDLLEAITRQDVSRALEIYQGLRTTKAQPLYVISMMGWQLKNLLIAKSAEKVNATSQQIVKDFKMSPFVVNKSLSAVRNIDFKNLKAAHSLIVTTDYKLKTTSVDADFLLEQLIYDIAQVFGSQKVRTTS